MTTVVIQPAYGNPIRRRNAKKTLHIDVPFGDERHAAGDALRLGAHGRLGPQEWVFR
jgi:hypothetical protein